MSVSAPHDGFSPSSRGVAANRHETMEELPAGATLGVASGEPRHNATENDGNVGASAPLSAPHAVSWRALHGVVWVLIDEDGRVVLERCEKKARVLGVGEWFLPGGKIEGGETPDECLRREIREEWPGVELLTARPLPIVEGSSVPPGPRGLFLMRPFVITVRGQVPSSSSEGTPLRWASIAEALASPVAQVRMVVAAADSSAKADDEPDMADMAPASEWEWRERMRLILADPDEHCPGPVYLSMACRIQELEERLPGSGVRIECRRSLHVPRGEAWFVDERDGSVIGKVAGLQP